MNNTNPLYYIEEGRFLSGNNPKAGWKMFKNGVSKNGFFETLKRNGESLIKRGEHVAKTKGVTDGRVKSAITNFASGGKKFLKKVGKSAVDGKPQSSDTTKKLSKLAKISKNATANNPIKSSIQYNVQDTLNP